MVFSPAGNTVATAGRDGRVILWDARTLDVLSVLQQEGEVRYVVMSGDGQHMVTSSGDDKLGVWNLVTRKLQCTLPLASRLTAATAHATELAIRQAAGNGLPASERKRWSEQGGRNRFYVCRGVSWDGLGDNACFPGRASGPAQSDRGDSPDGLHAATQGGQSSSVHLFSGRLHGMARSRKTILAGVPSRKVSSIWLAPSLGSPGGTIQAR